jgi:hypothetical protein
MGGEKCRKCGFVPIGAGLDKLPKKRKKRARRYVEPGSARGLLLFAVFGLGAYACFAFQPWKDDWELVRELFGQGRHHSVVGEWEIVKTLELEKGKSVIAAAKPNKGSFKFSKDGKVNINLVRGEHKTAGQGKYAVAGRLVAMNSLRATESEAGPLPTALNMNIAWTGPNTLVASCNGAEAIYLRRHPEGNPLVRLMQMGLKPQKGEVPGQVRGAIATMQTNVNKTLDTDE